MHYGRLLNSHILILMMGGFGPTGSPCSHRRGFGLNYLYVIYSNTPLERIFEMIASF